MKSLMHFFAKQKVPAMIVLLAATVLIILIFKIAYNQNGSEITTREDPSILLNDVSIVPADFFQKSDNQSVQCKLCFRLCIIPENYRGFCRVRENKRGILYTLVYGSLASTQVAPIEKDGMKHALPGTNVLAIATAGCNFRCQQCQNWHITQFYPEEVGATQFTPQEIVEKAMERNASTITGTINEPAVFYEYLYDVAVLASKAGLNMQFHTNGAIAEKPLRALLKHVDHVVVDLKGFNPDTYIEYYEGCFYNVKDTLRIIREEKVWLEIVNLVIPTVNDCMEEIRKMSEWIVLNLGPDVPLHFTRFFPAYRLLHLPPTPIETLETAHTAARNAGMQFVTIGNVPGHKYNSTFCPHCYNKLIHRVHFNVLSVNIYEGRCESCGEEIPGVWN